MKTLDDLTLHFLQDIYYAERQLLKALPKMAKAAQEPALKDAFLSHREETVHQIERLAACRLHVLPEALWRKVFLIMPPSGG